ncbi:autotransporter domain-containing protein [Sphingomonas cavernae]|uniref:Autotransporter domain-containing protein n=1 Tax=Sphingomonas cavernae TaxID=2320861 RepID=A0A418W778_9SPHN|nr:autotransporter domain-containing protein [Sphingomonas cavernae]RJF85827.1 autotransporter domain-containing protein [Sphingomonas cavernae]
MTSSANVRSLRRILMGAAALGIIAVANPALAQSANASDPPRPESAQRSPDIIIRNDLSPNLPPPAGILDSGVTGVGQMVIDAGGGFVGLCTGTLINPRTVIFAAHCVNDQAADSYGSATGGTAISFGFSDNNRPAARRWLGLDGGTLHATDVSRAIFNAEQVWYDPRSLATGFLEADVALATLDTPAFDVPTWTLLFTPLTEETHAQIIGYGTRGTSANPAQGIDFRRRAAENMLSVLGSLDDLDEFLFGAPSGLPQSLYQLDFDSPAGQAAFDPATGNFDFDLFDGAALPREGTTAGGDSGGPLVVDQRYDRPVVAGVLSGGTRFFGPQPFSTYGTSSFYQPLFLFWDQIVANNSYVYATNRQAIGNWTDPNHWVQSMDPNYAIDVNGQLVNALPGTPALGVSGDTVKFGKICFLDDCVDLADESVDPGEGDPNSIFIPGGPGSTNFVPNNAVANPVQGIKARYYDVTLKGPSYTTLGSQVTIDRMTLDSAAALSIRPTGSLKVLGDYTQFSGWSEVHGTLTTGEALFVSGILSGGGKIDPTWLTVVQAAVIPGSAGVAGTLTIAGDVILSSGATTIFDVSRPKTDKIVVVADAANTGIISLGGTAAFMRTLLGAAPRQGDSFQIISADGGVDGTFDAVVGGIGVLKPVLTYGGNDVTLKLQAGKFSDFLAGFGGTELAFANALDKLRGASYNNLYGLFGAVDLMEPQMLAATFRGLSPRVADEASLLDEQQSSIVLDVIGERLSMLGTSAAGGGRFTVIGSPEVVMSVPGQTLSGSSAAQLSFANSFAPQTRQMGRLPENMSGFVAGGFDRSASAFSTAGIDGGRDSWHMAMGLEMALDDRLILGTAFGHVDGISRFSGSETEAITDQAAVYGSYRLGGGAYAGGLAAVSHTRIGLQRNTSVGFTTGNLVGDTSATTYDLQAELGVNVDTGTGIMLTPRAQLAYRSYSMGGYRERGGELALMVDDIDIDRIESRLGVRMTGSLGSSRAWTFTPEIGVDWVNALAGGADTFNVRFAAVPELAFALPFAGRDKAWGEIKGGLRLNNGPVTFGAGVESSFARSDLRDDRAVVDFAWRF